MPCPSDAGRRWPADSRLRVGDVDEKPVLICDDDPGCLELMASVVEELDGLRLSSPRLAGRCLRWPRVSPRPWYSWTCGCRGWTASKLPAC